MSMKSVLICLTGALLALAGPLAPAQTKIIDLSPTNLDCSGQIVASTSNNGKLYNCQSASSALRDAVSGRTLNLPAGTETVFSSNPVSASATPSVPWILLPQTASIQLAGLAPIPQSNTTIKIRTIAQTYPRGRLSEHSVDDPAQRLFDGLDVFDRSIRLVVGLWTSIR